MDVLVLPILLILVVGAGRTSHANSETAMDYWQKLLPRTPVPPALLDLLNHHAGFNNLKFVEDSKNVHEARQVEEELKEISVTYGSQDNKKDLSNYMKVDMSQFHKDLKNKAMPSDAQTNKDIKMRLGGKHDKQKVMVASFKKNLAASAQNEESLKEISVSYGSKFEEGLKEISVSYGLEEKQDSKEVSMVDLKIIAEKLRNEENSNEISVSKLEEDLKEISVSYGSEGEKDRKEISVSYGAEGGEDVKEISVSYGQEDKDGLKKNLASEGDKVTAGEAHFHAHAHAHNHYYRSRRIADVFFLHDMLRPGTMMNPTIPPTSSLPALLPRHVANTIPFSVKRFPDIVAMFLPASLAIAGEMRWTLDTCEHPRPLPGQKGGCATSIESLAELTASLLGTHDVLAFSSDMPLEAAGTSALRARHNVTAARRLSTSLEVVTCHDLTYPYAVFYCHTSNPTAAYMVTLESEDGAAPAMEALAVCHLDTSQWNPENPFFKLHSVSPGEVAVCHFLSKLSIIWVRSGELRAAE